MTSRDEAQTVLSVVEQNGFVAIQEDDLKVEEDGEGWETVCYSKKNRTPEKCCGECVDTSRDHGGEPKVKRLVTASVDLQSMSKRATQEKTSEISDLVNKNDGNAANSSPELVDDKPLALRDDVLANGHEILPGSTTCDADESVPPIIRQESIEDKELTELNKNRYK